MELKKKSIRDEIKQELHKKVVGYIAAGFGLVAGLAWNEAIKALINHLFPLDKNSLLAKFIYAIVITLVAVIISVYLMKLFKKEEPKK